MAREPHPLSTIDLNLLKALDALLETRSVTRAAERLGRTQPAMSHALSRLRGLFDDPLFTRSGSGLTPTPRADALKEPIARLLTDAAALFDAPDGFQPSRTRRRFRIATPDLCVPVLAKWIHDIRSGAPAASVAVETVDVQTAGRLRTGALDAAIAPGRYLEQDGLEYAPIGVLRWTVFHRPDASAASGDGLTIEAWASAAHAQVSTGAAARSPVDDAATNLGITRTIGARTPSFLAALAIAADADLLFTAPARPLQPLAERLGLAQSPPPLSIAPIPLGVSWLARSSEDPASRWLVERLKASAESIAE